MIQHLKKLLKGSAIYGIGAALNQALNVLLTPLFTSYFSPEDHSIFSVLGFFSAILSTIFLFGFGTSIGLCYYENSSVENKRKTIWTSFIVLLIAAIFMLILFYPSIDYYNHYLFKNAYYPNYIAITLVSSVFTNILIPLTLYLQFEEKQLGYVMITVITTIFSISVRIIAVVYIGAGVNGVVIGQFLAVLLQFLITFLWVVRYIKFGFSIEITKKLFRYGLPLIPSFFTLFVLQQGNVYFLEQYSNSRELGLYSIGFSIGSFITLITNAIATAWFPFAMSFQEKRQEAETIFGKITTYYAFAVGSISLCFYVFARPVIHIMTNYRYWDAEELVGLSATTWFLAFFFNLLLPPMYFEKETKYVSLIQAISSGGYVLVALWLIPIYGNKGAFLSLLLGYGFMNLLFHLWNRYKYPAYIGIRYEKKKLISFIFLYVGFVYFHYLFNNFLISTILFICFVLCLVYLLDKTEKDHIKAVLSTIKFKNNG